MENVILALILLITNTEHEEKALEHTILAWEEEVFMNDVDDSIREDWVI